MQPQYSQGAAPSHQPAAFAPPEVPQPNGSVTSSLRQWRKKDYVDKQQPPEQPQTSAAENPSHVARVAPHTYYPRLPNDLCHYQHQYSEYGVPFKSAPVKYSEIVDSPQQPVDGLKLKEKEFGEFQHTLNPMKQSYPEGVNPAVHQSHLHPFLQKQQMQYIQKEPYQQFMPKYGMQGQYQAYQSETNNFLARLNKINPQMAQSIINDTHLRESQMPPTMYHTLDQNRTYPQQRMYHPSIPTAPPNHARNIQGYNYPQPYNYNLKNNMQPSDPYNRVHQYQQVPRFDYKMNMDQSIPNISPQRMYNEGMHMNYSPMSPKISPNYPAHCSQLEYAQHYQHRRTHMPQEYYPHTYKPPYAQNPQTSPESQEARTRKSSLKQYLETWVEEDMAGNLPDLIMSNNLDDNMEGIKGICVKSQEQPLYVLDSTEIPNENLPHFLHLQQVEKLPDNIRGYYQSANSVPNRRIIIENNPEDEMRNMYVNQEMQQRKMVERSQENKVVQIHIVEEESTDEPTSDRVIIHSNIPVPAEQSCVIKRHEDNPELKNVKNMPVIDEEERAAEEVLKETARAAEASKTELAIPEEPTTSRRSSISSIYKEMELIHREPKEEKPRPNQEVANHTVILSTKTQAPLDLNLNEDDKSKAEEEEADPLKEDVEELLKEGLGEKPIEDCETLVEDLSEKVNLTFDPHVCEESIFEPNCQEKIEETPTPVEETIEESVLKEVCGNGTNLKKEEVPPLSLENKSKEQEESKDLENEEIPEFDVEVTSPSRPLNLSIEKKIEENVPEEEKQEKLDKQIEKHLEEEDKHLEEREELEENSVVREEIVVNEERAINEEEQLFGEPKFECVTKEFSKNDTFEQCVEAKIKEEPPENLPVTEEEIFPVKKECGMSEATNFDTLPILENFNEDATNNEIEDAPSETPVASNSEKTMPVLECMVEEPQLEAKTNRRFSRTPRRLIHKMKSSRLTQNGKLKYNLKTRLRTKPRRPRRKQRIEIVEKLLEPNQEEKVENLVPECSKLDENENAEISNFNEDKDEEEKVVTANEEEMAAAIVQEETVVANNEEVVANEEDVIMAANEGEELLAKHEERKEVVATTEEEVVAINEEVVEDNELMEENEMIEENEIVEESQVIDEVEIINQHEEVLRQDEDMVCHDKEAFSGNEETTAHNEDVLDINREMISQKEEMMSPKGEMLNQSEETVNQSEKTVNQSEEMVNQTEEMVGHSEDIVNQSKEMVNQSEEMVNQSEDVVNQSEEVLGECEDMVNQCEELVSQCDEVSNQNEETMSQNIEINENEEIVCQDEDVMHQENATPNQNEDELDQSQIVIDQNKQVVHRVQDEKILDQNEETENQNEELENQNEELVDPNEDTLYQTEKEENQECIADQEEPSNENLPEETEENNEEILNNANIIYQIENSNILLQIADELLEINVTNQNGKKTILVKTFSDAAVMQLEENVEKVPNNEEACEEQLLNNNYLEMCENPELSFGEEITVADDVYVYNEEIVSSSTELDDVEKVELKEDKEKKRKPRKEKRVSWEDECLNQKPEEPFKKCPKTKAALKYVPKEKKEQKGPVPSKEEEKKKPQPKKPERKKVEKKETKNGERFFPPEETQLRDSKPPYAKKKTDKMKATRIKKNAEKPKNLKRKPKETKIAAKVEEIKVEPETEEKQISVQENSITSSTNQESEIKERNVNIIQQISDEWDDDEDTKESSNKRILSLQEYNNRKRTVFQKTPPPLKFTQKTPRLDDLQKPDLTDNLFTALEIRKRDPSPDSPMLSVKFSNKTYSRTSSKREHPEENLSSAIELNLPKKPRSVYNQEYLKNALVNDLNAVSAYTNTLVKENQQLMQRFLEQKHLTVDELKTVKKIIRYKRLVQHLSTIKISEMPGSEVRPDTDLLFPAHPLSEENKRKKKRFRFLYSDEEPEEKKPRLVVSPVVDYSVHQSNTQGQLTLVFKRSFKSDPKMQPYVKLERLPSIDLLAQKLY